MSVQAISWALEQQEVRDPETQLVLLCLANYAAADGTNSFPSNERLVRDTRLSERTVRRHLRKLEQMILIRRGNQAIAAAHIKRADRRPVVYDLLISRGVTETPRADNGGSVSPPEEATGGHKPAYGGSLKTERGVTNRPTGGQALAPDPSDPSFNRHDPTRARVSPTDSRANPEQRQEFIRQLRQRAAQPFESSKRDRR